MAEPIPDKGRVLTAMSAFWFEQFADVVGSHLISTDLADLPEAWRRTPSWPGRIMLCRQAEMLPIECIVRGYITGSAWKEYRRSGTMHGDAAAGRACSSRRQLPEPMFTPVDQGRRSATTTRTSPSSDAVDADRHRAGRAGPRRRRSSSTPRGSAWAAERGIIIADTKFELGLVDGELVLADEVLTPDSSRFWPADRVGARAPRPPSFDKQPVRDYLDDLDWDKQPAAPAAARRGRRRHQRPLRRGLRAHHRPLLRRLAGRRPSRLRAGCVSAGRMLLLRARRGPARGRASPIRRAPPSSGRCPTLGFDGVSGVRVGKSIRFDDRGRRRGRGPRRGRRPVPPVPHQPGDRGRRRRARPWPGAAVDEPPGSASSSSPAPTASTTCVEAVALARRRAPRSSGTATPTLDGVDAVVVPGGFAHGDYLRPGAIARFSPVMDAVADVRRRRRPGRRHLQRLPGAHRGRPAARRAAEERGPQVPVRHGRAAGRVHRLGAHQPAPRSAQVLRIPINHFEGNYTCDAETLGRAAGRRPHRAALRRQPERLGRRHRRHLQRGPQRGRAHAAPRAGLQRPAGLGRRPAAAASLLVAWPWPPARGAPSPGGDVEPRSSRSDGAAADAGGLQGRGGHADLAPGRVGDALALGVALGRRRRTRPRAR